MTTPTPCAGRCTFHTKRDTHLPCRACQSKHAAFRAEERHDSVVSTAPGLRADKRSSALSASRSNE